MTGETILHYRILEKLGEGGMGVVHLAEDTKLERKVAIKFLPRQIAINEEEQERFKIEARAAAALNHPNIATIYAIEETDDPHGGKEIFIVMEYIEGRELKEIIKSEIPNLQSAIEYATQIAEGLQAAHEKGIIHRDIKSSNIMITSEGRVKIMDFGLAKVAGAAVHLTKENSTLGTAAYMSPEQARGAEIDNRTDIWSFGVVLYEMLAGKLPFTGDYEQAIIYSILNEAPEPVPDANTGVSAEIRKISEKCLQRRKANRYQNMQGIIADLHDIRREGATHVNEPVATPRPLTEPPHRRSRKRLYWSAILVLLIIAAFSLLIYSGGKENNQAGQRVQVAVADFINLTADKELDALSGMLITSLEQSRKLAVLSRSRMLDILQQLGKSNASIIDETLGREICRQANIHALILPAIRKFGKVYSVDFKALDPQSGEYLFTLNARDEGQEEIPSLIDHLSEETRKQLRENEAEIQVTSKKVAQVTTPNLEAYQHYFRGEEYLNRLHLDSAKAEFRKAITLDTTFGLAYYRLAYAMGWNAEELSEGPLQKALRYIDRIPEKERYLVRAEQVRQEKGFAAAIPILKEMEKFYPQDKEMLFNIGDWAFHSGDYKTAKKYFEKVLALDPSHQRTLYHYNITIFDYYTNSAYFSGDLNLALSKAKESLQKTPDSPGLCTAIAIIYTKLGEYKKAEAQANRCIGKFGDSSQGASIVRIIPSIYLYTGKYQTALEVLDRILANARTSGNIGILVNGNIIKAALEWLEYKNIKEVRKSIDEIVPLIEQHPVPFAWDNTATLYAFAGDYDKAAIVLKNHPGQGAAVSQIIIHSLQGKCSEGEAIYANIENLPVPRFVKLWCLYSLGECYLKSGALDKGKDFLTRAQAMSEGDTEPFRAMYYPRAFLWLGKIYEKQGETEKAIQSYEKLMRLWKDADPNLPEPAEAKQRLARLKGV